MDIEHFELMGKMNNAIQKVLDKTEWEEEEKMALIICYAVEVIAVAATHLAEEAFDEIRRKFKLLSQLEKLETLRETLKK